MISNYFTLLHSARVLDERLRGARVRGAYTQEKRRLCLTIENPPLLATVVLSCVPSENYVLMTEGSSRARANAVDLLPAIAGRRIEWVRCDGADRVLVFGFEGGSQLRAEFFGVRANCFLLAPEGIIEDCFLHKQELMTTDAEARRATALAPVPRPSEAAAIVGGAEDFSAAFGGAQKATALAALKAAVPKLGAILAEEMLFRSQIELLADPARLTPGNLQRLYDSSLQSVADLLDCNTLPQARIYWDGRRVVCFSLLGLRSRSAWREERFEDLFEAVRRAISSVKARGALGSEKETVQTWLEKEIAKTERTLLKMQEDERSNDRASLYETQGALLMANLARVERGAREIVLEEFDGSGAVQTIALDPSLPPARNAARYFERAKHARLSAREAGERRASLEAHLRALRPVLEELKAVETREALKEFHARFGALLKQQGYMTETELEQLPPFRIFTVDGGFQVLAGKSSENNDLLTTKYAKPNDLWFHARGSSGSHVVLKVGSAPGEPTKKAVHQAASIAAYYSKMKNASAVPVAMTEKKFVHKPKGVPAGTVTLDREKVIFVEPKLPDTGQHI